MLKRELVVFLVAVLVGSLAATLAAATHHRLVHKQPLRLLAPKVAFAAPLAYVVMRAVHLVIGS
jgi:hypothetical protein